MILYFIQISLIWTVLLLAFFIGYKNRAFHHFNRCYLLSAVVMGLVIPLISWSCFELKLPQSLSLFHPVYLFQEIQISATTSHSFFNLGNLSFVLLGIYASLMIYKLFETYQEFCKIKILIKNVSDTPLQEQVLFSDQVYMPFSFMNTIVLPTYLKYEERIKSIILYHEQRHIQLAHWYDLFFLKLMDVFFPFHPCLYYFKKELKLIHEYQADEYAVKYIHQDEYAALLVRFANHKSQFNKLIFTFNHSPIKSRIMMLFKKSPANQVFSFALAPVLFLACTFLFSEQQIKNATNDKMEGTQISKTDTSILSSAEKIQDKKLPVFPGGTNALIEFMSNNINYPESGKSNKVEGLSMIAFTVYEDGSLHDLRIKRSLGEAFDQELIRVVKLMPNWIPGEKDGKKIKAEFTLPVKFKLPGNH